MTKIAHVSAGGMRVSDATAALLGGNEIQIVIAGAKAGVKLPPREAADLLGTDVMVLATMRARKRGPHYERKGNTITYSIEDIVRWLNERPWTRHRSAVDQEAAA